MPLILTFNVNVDVFEELIKNKKFINFSIFLFKIEGTKS